VSKKQSPKQLRVYLNSRPLGYLEYKDRQSLSFFYLPEWIKRDNSFPISRSLPLREEPYSGDKVYAYFDNLLPDGISIRQRMAARMRAASDQVFDLLAVFGRDCVGALQFLSEDLAKPVLENAVGHPVSDVEIANKLKNLRASPLAASEEDDFRLSIAGAQEKTAFLFYENMWQVPIGATPTTHIFKPQIGELKPGLSFSDSVENEWLCAQIVKAFGLPVANCEITNFEDVKVLVVERFDRAWVGDWLIRIPQEDMCQALSIPNFEKYESDGGPNIKTIMELLLESKQPEIDRLNFLKTQVIFFLLAAIDGHAKNFSIHWSIDGFQMAPLYDILSAHHMVSTGKFQFEKLKMAMTIGDNRHYKVKEIYRRHFIQTAKACRVDTDQMDYIIDEIIVALPNVIDSVRTALPSDFPMDIAESIFSGMNRLSNSLKFISST
jgi:serine/threonine-protein kinase HipA